MNSPAWWYPQGHPHKGDLKRAELLLGPSIRHQEQCHALRKTSPQADLSLPISNQLFDMGIKGRGNNVLPISRIGWNIDGIQPFGRIGVDSVFCIGPRIAKVIPMRRPTPQHGVELPMQFVRSFAEPKCVCQQGASHHIQDDARKVNFLVKLPQFDFERSLSYS